MLHRLLDQSLEIDYISLSRLNIDSVPVHSDNALVKKKELRPSDAIVLTLLSLCVTART